MLAVHQISKSFNLDIILDRVSFTLGPGQRLGLIGHNGTGKSTLLRIIAGQLAADSGQALKTPADLRIGYLPQGLLETEGLTVGGLLDQLQGEPDRLADLLEQTAQRLAHEPDNRQVQEEYDRLLNQLSAASSGESARPAVLTAFDLQRFPMDTPLSHLSGGQKTRLGLAGLLLGNPQLLLLDEPTNHLDFAMLEWLEDWLLAYRGAALVVSHDRVFLDRVVTGILEIEPHERTLKAYAGGYSDYLDQLAAERERLWQAYRDQQDEIARLRAAAARMRSRARFHKGGKADPTQTDGFSAGFFANRGKETIQKAKNIEKRIEHMLTDQKVERPGRTWEMKIDFSADQQSGRDVLVLEDLAVGYDGKPLLEGLNLHIRSGARAVLVGPNGTGKTTLLRTVAGELAPVSGRFRLGTSVRLGYLAQEQETLDLSLNPFQTIQKLSGFTETGSRAFLSKFLFKGDQVFIPVGKLSFGERTRLSLACLVAQGCNFLLLDEPVNHLDIPSRTRFEQALSAFDGTWLAVVHDRFFIEQLAGEVWELKADGIRPFRMDEPMSDETLMQRIQEAQPLEDSQAPE